MRYLLLFFFVNLSAESLPNPLDNEIIGQPVIFCEKDRIRLEVETAKPFRGKVFVKGEYGTAGCTRVYPSGHSGGERANSAKTAGNSWDSGLSSSNVPASHSQQGGSPDSNTGFRSQDLSGTQGNVPQRQKNHSNPAEFNHRSGENLSENPSLGTRTTSAPQPSSTTFSAIGNLELSSGSQEVDQGTGGLGSGTGSSSNAPSGSGLNSEAGKSSTSGTLDDHKREFDQLMAGVKGGLVGGKAGEGGGLGGADGRRGPAGGIGGGAGGGSEERGRTGGVGGREGQGGSLPNGQNTERTFPNGAQVQGKHAEQSGVKNTQIDQTAGSGGQAELHKQDGPGPGASGQHFGNTGSTSQNGNIISGHAGLGEEDVLSPGGIENSGKYGYAGGLDGIGHSVPPLKVFPSLLTSTPSIEGQCPPTTCAPCACGASDQPQQDEEHNEPLHRGRRQTNKVELEVMLGTCRAKRDRTISPPGVFVSFVAVVSFHESFITKLDRAYHIKCAYTESNKTVDTMVDVSAPPEETLSHDVESPRCEYQLTNQEGQQLKGGAKVGDVVRHQWICNSEVPEAYGLLVHSCFVEGSGGQKHMVIDEHGCSLDDQLLSTPIYPSSLGPLSAYVDAFAFKFPDQENVDFQCNIHVCTKYNGQCEELTPPNCSAGRNSSSRRRRSTTSSSDNEWILHSPTLAILDMDGKTELPASLALTSPPSSTEMCLSVLGFGSLIASATFVCTASIGFVIAYLFLRSN